MHVRMRLHSAPSPPHLHCRRPVLCNPLRRTRQCSWGRHNRSIFISIIRSPASPYSEASISQKHPSTLTHLLSLRFLPSSILVSHKTASSAVAFWANLPSCVPLIPFRSAGLAVATVPLSGPLHRHPLSEEPFRKRQASCLFFLQKCLLAGQLVFHCPSGG